LHFTFPPDLAIDPTAAVVKWVGEAAEGSLAIEESTAGEGGMLLIRRDNGAEVTAGKSGGSCSHSHALVPCLVRVCWSLLCMDNNVASRADVGNLGSPHPDMGRHHRVLASRGAFSRATAFALSCMWCFISICSESTEMMLSALVTSYGGTLL
jgi:hypothetical protein